MDRPVDPRLPADVLSPEAEEATQKDQLRAQQAALVAAAGRELSNVASVVLGERFGSLHMKRTEDRAQREYFVLQDTQGNSATLWVDAIPMATGSIANTVTNTASDQYIVQISDRLPSEHLTRVLAHEVGELVAVRDRSSQGMAPVRESLLEQGAEFGARNELSSQDHGRIGELNWLADRAADMSLPEQQRTESRAELSALLDHCGLRPVAPMAELEAHAGELEAAESRRYVSRDFLSSHAKRLVRDLARPIEQLDPTDAAALQASRDAALLAQRQVEAFIGRRNMTMPLPGYDQNGLPLPRDQLGTAAEQWADYRAQVSDRTVQALEGRLAAQQMPLRQVVIGGGASLTGRNPEALLVDGAGRWHLDPGAGIVQSADQDRDLAQWMGVDPYQAVEDPRQRVPIEAVRLWEDQLATQGDVVNGHARLRLGRNGELLAEVRPFDQDGKASAKPLWVACDGTPSIATGLTPEVVPGMERGASGVESRGEAVRLICERLRDLEGQGVTGAAELRASLTQAERGGADTATVLDTLEPSPLREALKAGLEDGAATRMDNCFIALKATQKWEAAREAAPGRALMGDEVAENRFDPGDAKHWIIAGSGGTGVANAEIILKENPHARVTIVGRMPPPPALAHQVQYPAMERKHVAKEGGDGRLTLINADVRAIDTYRDENGRTCFRVPYVDEKTKESKTLEADGYVASLGRTNPLPPALQVLANEVRDLGGEIDGDLLFDKDDQYIGYGLTFRTKDGRQHQVDVDGAASWQLPREVFSPGTQGQLNQMGARALPAETGNASPGFSPIARQSALRARAVAAAQAGDEHAVQRLATVPERWKRPERPEPTAEAEQPGGGPGTPPPAPAQTAEVPRRPAPPTPGPAPGRGAPDAHLWQLGVPQARRARPAGPAQQPHQPPPDHHRPGPGLGPGMGD
ncbi:hypothetical protein [Streptomyces vilmorinianum]|uniref:hypothetical protein n=1 Tax=Streptomyces vilmorinianum TaxID=3051092 RepID=UPI0010FB60A2|nr:hypothetical protein [Streptomyces vilmorinianum]